MLNTGRTVEHWHTRTKTGEVPILERLSPSAWLEMNPRDARALRLKPHDRVDVVSRRGRVRGVELRVTEIVAPGQVFMPFHYAETNANQVTQSAFDPISREPNYKQCAVRLRRRRMAEAPLHGDCSDGSCGQPRGVTMEELVVVGNGMAGVACVEQILKHAPKFRHHRLRRRDARQLQPHPALVGARRREDAPTRSCSTRSSGTSRNDIDLRLGVPHRRRRSDARRP